MLYHIEIGKITTAISPLLISGVTLRGVWYQNILSIALLTLYEHPVEACEVEIGGEDPTDAGDKDERFWRVVSHFWSITSVTDDLSEHNEATNEHVDDDPIEGWKCEWEEEADMNLMPQTFQLPAC